MILYRIDGQGSAVPCSPVRAMNEAAELQHVLAKNLFLLPGHQVDPESPRRWMLVREEMPVPDPAGGGSRWSVDLLLTDQSGVPTFIECKRYADTRSRREVIGQMLEYAANGHHYWDHGEIRRFAEESAERAGRTIEEAFAGLASEDFETLDELIERFIENLREGQVRLVFFMEEAPQELKSIVDFLNRQTERTEILIVEARQFDSGGERFVVPALFGYTEEARRAKRSVTVVSGQKRRKWTEDSFFSELATNRGDSEVDLFRRVLDLGRELGLEIRWGTGAHRGTMSLVASALCPRSFVSLYTDAGISFNLAWLDGSSAAVALRENLERGVAERLGLTPKGADTAYWMYPADEWLHTGEALVGLVREVVGVARGL